MVFGITKRAYEINQPHYIKVASGLVEISDDVLRSLNTGARKLLAAPSPVDSILHGLPAIGAYRNLRPLINTTIYHRAACQLHTPYLDNRDTMLCVMPKHTA